MFFWPTSDAASSCRPLLPHYILAYSPKEGPAITHSAANQLPSAAMTTNTELKWTLFQWRGSSELLSSSLCGCSYNRAGWSWTGLPVSICLSVRFFKRLKGNKKVSRNICQSTDISFLQPTLLVPRNIRSQNLTSNVALTTLPTHTNTHVIVVSDFIPHTLTTNTSRLTGKSQYFHFLPKKQTALRKTLFADRWLCNSAVIFWQNQFCKRVSRALPLL